MFEIKGEREIFTFRLAQLEDKFTSSDSIVYSSISLWARIESRQK